MKQRGVLLVSYHYPPVGGSGVQRAEKLARYLPAAGWRVHVLTAGHAHFPILDTDGLVERAEGVTVHRVRGLEPGALAARLCGWVPRRGRAASEPGRLENSLYWRLDRWMQRLRLPEPEWLWMPSAVRAARRIILDHDIDAVVTTSPPHSVQEVGRRLHRQCGIPWIADLRDPILDNFAYAPRTGSADRRWRRLEAATLHEATRVVVSCPDWLDPLHRRYGDALAEKCSVVPNGYDPADRPPEPRPTRPTGDRFVLAHVGSFYRAQSMAQVLTAVRRVTSRRPETAGRFELRVVGSVSARDRRHLLDSDDAFLRLAGYRTHREAVVEMARADALFLMTPADPRGRFCIPAKVFEYLAFGPHIIALVHADSATERILAEAGNVTLVRHGEADGLERAIVACHAAWSRGQLNESRARDVVARFRRDRLARQYAQILSTCAIGSAAPGQIPAPEAMWGAA